MTPIMPGVTGEANTSDCSVPGLMPSPRSFLTICMVILQLGAKLPCDDLLRLQIRSPLRVKCTKHHDAGFFSAQDRQASHNY